MMNMFYDMKLYIIEENKELYKKSVKIMIHTWLSENNDLKFFPCLG